MLLQKPERDHEGNQMYLRGTYFEEISLTKGYTYFLWILWLFNSHEEVKVKLTF
jgi:hypothetical protein